MTCGCGRWIEQTRSEPVRRDLTTTPIWNPIRVPSKSPGAQRVKSALSRRMGQLLIVRSVVVGPTVEPPVPVRFRRSLRFNGTK
jgi:hypothetical protein